MASSDSAPHSKEAVLEAARKLLMQHGYAGLSMRELARQSGLAKGTIYHHFPDKRAIFLSVLERSLGEAQRCVQEAAAREGGFEVRLRSVVHAYLQLQQEQSLLTLWALRDSAGLEPQVCALIRAYRHDLTQPIEAIFDAAIAEGVIRPIHVEMTVMSLLGILQSFVAHRALLIDPAIGAEVVEHTLDLLLHGLLTARDPATPTHSTHLL